MPGADASFSKTTGIVEKTYSPNLTLTGEVSMKLEAAKFVVMLVVFGLTVPDSLNAQTASATLSGTVTAPSGSPVANAKISVRNVSTGESAETQTDSAGKYSIKNLTPADYDVTVSAAGFPPKTVKVTLGAGVQQTVDLTAETGQSGATGATPAATAPQNLPNAPSSSQTEPSLSDLGFSPEQTQSNPKEQALLEKRTRMLRIHQKMGLITTAPLIASVVLGVGAGGKKTSSTDRTAHLVLGAVTGDLYFITAYYAIRAPRVEGTKSKGPIRFHKAMAWIHGPGMILTPILGALAYNQKSNGEKVHGIASAHGPVAIVTAGAFGAALLSVSMKF
jgi:hypothetical protein